MKIYAKIKAENDQATVRELFINDKFYCFTLEDEKRAVKVKGETRIPDGTYKLGLRTVGGHHEKYKKDYPEFHIGMIQVLNVPNFSDILIHKGNYDTDTDGCLLVGMTFMNQAGVLSVLKSGDAYRLVYPLISKAIASGDDVTLTIDSFY